MMDFVIHSPRTSRGHDAVWVIVDWLTKSTHFFSGADDLYAGGILQVVYTRDCLVTWSAGLYSIGLGSQVYGSFLGEFLGSHRNTVDDEHFFSSSDGWSVREDHPNFRGHAMGIRPRF